MKNRLFTFGCSYTGYFWPTWADIIGTQFKEHHNYGKPGTGNYFALSQLNEVNEVYNLTKDDTVLVMISSDNRADFIQWMGTWTATGGIYADGNFDYFGKTFPEKIWSPLHGLHNTWICLKSMKLLLDSIGCDYRVYTAFDVDDDGKDFWLDMLSSNDMLGDVYDSSAVNWDSVVVLKDRITKLLSSTISLDGFIDKKTPRYVFNDSVTGEYFDGHPRVEEHLKWVNEVAGDFYDKRMESIVDEWSKISDGGDPQEILNECGCHLHNELITGKELK